MCVYWENTVTNCLYFRWLAMYMYDYVQSSSGYNTYAYIILYVLDLFCWKLTQAAYVYIHTHTLTDYYHAYTNTYIQCTVKKHQKVKCIWIWNQVSKLIDERNLIDIQSCFPSRSPHTYLFPSLSLSPCRSSLIRGSFPELIHSDQRSIVSVCVCVIRMP